MTPDSRLRCLRLVAAGALMLLAGSALALSGGPGYGLSGAPGENTCTQCHSSFTLNAGDGAISISGSPDAHTPGESCDVTVTLADPLASRCGCELTLPDAAGTGDLTLYVAGRGVGSGSYIDVVGREASAARVA
ncbi:MAG: choice-of-anchor V domain-containing protein [Candidatus Krumholzibacteriia bacterium]